MVRKIQSNEYLMRYDNMKAQEQEEYESRVGQWLSDNAEMLAEKSDVFEARMQNVLQVSTAWNDQECHAFEDGAYLLSALVPTADTWLPDMLYAKSAKRAIRQMIMTLNTVGNEAKEEPAEGTAIKTQAVAKEPAAEANTTNVSDATSADAAEPTTPFQTGAGDGNITGGDNKGEVQVKPDGEASGTATPARPKHIDQYVHLLPKKTQEHAALVQGLYRELEEARQKLNLLVSDKTASAADREAWAKKATKCDNTLRKILNELDTEWAKLAKSGRVVVDDLGNARILPVEASSEEEPVELTSEQKARRRELRKWLTDVRRGNGASRDERVKQWYTNFVEYLTLEGDKAFDDEKIKEAIEHFGIDTNKLKEGK